VVGLFEVLIHLFIVGYLTKLKAVFDGASKNVERRYGCVVDDAIQSPIVSLMIQNIQSDIVSLTIQNIWGADNVSLVVLIFFNF
jgi:hypothetical protein